MTHVSMALLLTLLIHWSAAKAEPEATPDVTMNTVTVNGGGEQMKISYINLRKFRDRFRSSGAGSRSVESHLILGVGDSQSGFALNYIDKAGNKAQVLVNKYGIVDLPDLDSEFAKTTFLTTRLPGKASHFSVSIAYIPYLQSRQELRHEDYTKYISDTNAAYENTSWSARLLFTGRLKAKATGMVFCFSGSDAAIVIGGIRTPVDPNGCLTHHVNFGFAEQKPTIVFDGELVHVQMLQSG